jgi:hypothetical protein
VCLLSVDVPRILSYIAYFFDVFVFVNVVVMELECSSYARHIIMTINGVGSRPTPFCFCFVFVFLCERIVIIKSLQLGVLRLLFSLVLSHIIICLEL